MSEPLYEVIALGMRYLFSLLGVLIVLRSLAWLRKDQRATAKRLRRLPDAGTIGELVVVQGTRDLPEGAVISVPWEGVFGFTRTCDIVVPVEGIASQHMDFSFEEGLGLLLYPHHRRMCLVDGQPCNHRHCGRKTPVLHGSTIDLGDCQLRLRVFAGIDVPHFAAFAEDVPPCPPPAPLWQIPPMMPPYEPNGMVPPPYPPQAMPPIPDSIPMPIMPPEGLPPQAIQQVPLPPQPIPPMVMQPPYPQPIDPVSPPLNTSPTQEQPLRPRHRRSERKWDNA